MADARQASRLVMLVSTAVFINYVDRGNLSTAATLVQQQLSLNEAQLGILFSAFYYGYVPIMPLTSRTTIANSPSRTSAEAMTPVETAKK